MAKGTLKVAGADAFTASDLAPDSVGTSEIATDATGTAGEALNKTGMEIGYNTMVGPVALSTVYGSASAEMSDALEGYTYTDIEVAMSISF